MESEMPSPADVLRREAAFRLKVIKDFRELELTLRRQTQEIDALNERVADRDRYVHSLHLERDATNQEFNRTLGARDEKVHELHQLCDTLRAEIAAARADVEVFAFRAEESDNAAREARHALRVVTESLAGKLAAPFVRMQKSLLKRAREPRPALLQGVPLNYSLDQSPFRVFRAPEYRVSGWIQTTADEEVCAVRVRISGIEFATTTAIKDDGRVVFSADTTLPEGKSWLQIEVQRPSDLAWRSIVNAPLLRVAS